MSLNWRCLLGLHDYGEPQRYTGATIRGTRRTDGTWETEIDNDPEDAVTWYQFCARCKKDRVVSDPDGADAEEDNDNDDN